MLSFTAVNEPLVIVLSIVLIIMAMGQSLHLFFVFFQERPEKGSPRTPFITRLLYEASLIAYLLGLALALGLLGAGSLKVLGLPIPLEAVNGIGAIPVVFGAVCCLFNKPRLLLALETALLAAAPAALLCGWQRFCLASIMLIISYLLFRIVRNVLEDEKTRQRTLTHFSTVDAINKLPAGVLCLTDTGEVLIMNQAMRTSLQALHLPTDLSDLTDIWKHLEAKAVRTTDAGEDVDEGFGEIAGEGTGEVPGEHKSEGRGQGNAPLILTANGRYRLFEQRTMERKGRCYPTIIAVDITQEERLNQLIAQGNREIDTTGRQIQASLEDVQQVAHQEALHSLRAKVHDIIGQRLSILHRLLEDERLSDQALAEIKPLLKNILSDLQEHDFQAQTELDGIVEAFALINVDVKVEGTLPEDPMAANAFVSVIREAATNAVRHAQARQVFVDLRQTRTQHILTVSNHYAPETNTGRTGSGIPNMCKAVEGANGTLSVQTAPDFVVRACIPVPQSPESEEQ